MSVPSGLLTAVRRQVDRMLPDSCAIVRVTRTQNDSGGWTEATSTLATVACRLGPLSGRERVLGGRVVEESDAVISVPDSADVRGSDRITHGGNTYEVVDVVARSERMVQRVFVRGLE